MSADNVIIIKRIDKAWHVWHASMSLFIEGEEDNPPKDDVDRHHVFESWEEANTYAEDLEKEIGIVEYGIVEAGAMSDLAAREQKRFDQKEVEDFVNRLKETGK